MADLLIDVNGTPAVIANGNANMSVGCPGTGILSVLTGGAVVIPLSNPANGTAATTVAGSGTIDTTIFWQRVTTAGAVTGIILEAGTTHGQLCLISVDKDAAGSLTMAAAGTSRVGSGTGCVLAVGSAGLFIWDATDAIWAEMSS